jgi:hypothetical protein
MVSQSRPHAPPQSFLDAGKRDMALKYHKLMKEFEGDVAAVRNAKA